MRLLFDITHPVNVYFFKDLIRRFSQEGSQVLVTARDKDVTLELLSSFGIPHVPISRQQRGLLGMAKELFQRNLRLIGLARRFRPDVMVASEGGVSVGPVGMMLGIPQVVFDQVDIAPLQQLVGLTFARTICTSSSYRRHYGSRHVRFRGFLVQSYLDPRRFRPDLAAIRQAGIEPTQPLIVLRLVRWSASHDRQNSRKALATQRLVQAVDRLSRFGRVLISSEEPLPPSLAPHANPVPAIHLHSLLACASLVLAEGGTVGVEAGVLGTPAICFHTYDFGYLRALEQKYRVIRRVASSQEALDLAEVLLEQDDLRRRWSERAKALFEDTVDVAEVMYRLVAQAASGSAGIGRKRRINPCGQGR
jgi:predicted glycosyltransferase